MTIEKIKAELVLKAKTSRKIQEFAENQLSQSPEGTLTTRKQYGGIRYISQSEGKQTYLNRSEAKKIKALQQKLYCKKLYVAATENNTNLEKVIHILGNIKTPERVFLEIPPEKRSMIEPYQYMNQKEVPKIFTKYKSPNRVDNSSFKTLNGEYVRSKSELIIADRLKASGVVYDYEPPILADGELDIWHPDFLVLNGRTGETYYWEHFGMLDNPEYCESFQFKMERYAKIGIFPGINLLVTTESSKHPLSTEYVDTLIRQFLL